MVTSTGSLRRPRAQLMTRPVTYPIASPPATAHRKPRLASTSENPVARVATAIRIVTRAAASLKRLSPSSKVMRRSGRPRRRPMLVAATASIGDTAAPSAMASGREISQKSSCPLTPTRTARTMTRTILSHAIGLRFRRSSITGTLRPEAKRIGGSTPRRTISFVSSTSGIHGVKLATIPSTRRRSGAAMPVRREKSAEATRTVSPTSARTMSSIYGSFLVRAGPTVIMLTSRPPARGSPVRRPRAQCAPWAGRPSRASRSLLQTRAPSTTSRLPRDVPRAHPAPCG